MLRRIAERWLLSVPRLPDGVQRFFKGSVASGIAVGILLVFVVFGVFGPVIAPYSATEMISADARQPPSWHHLFGTDHLGRDVFSRVVFGTRSILGLTGSGAAIAVVLGTLLGLLAGYIGGWPDELIMRLFDSLLAIPALLLALVLLGTIGPSSSGVLIVIAVVYTPIVARVVRSETLALRQRGFVETARLQGEPLWRILVQEILPSVFPALSVEAALRFSYAIFLVASLGFLGVGVQPPTPDWGLMVKEARIFIGLTPWALFFPAGAISLLVISVNLAADGIKRALQGEEVGLRRRARRAVVNTRLLSDAACRSGGEPDATGPLVRVEGLTVSYFRSGTWRDALRNVSLNVRAGETYGLVGESGSGKSSLALAIVGYLAENGAAREGTVCIHGREVRLHAPVRHSRDTSVALVAQDALAALNPSIRIGKQIREVLGRHRNGSGRDETQELHRLLRRVELRDPERIEKRYPHELSGGMLQRVALAMALGMQPKLLLLDEPTTGLDVTTQASILDLMKEVLAAQRHATLHISHDLDVIFSVSDRVGVLYAGELLEEATAMTLLDRSYHPYTQGLLASRPRLERSIGGRSVLSAMAGSVPDPGRISPGCVFADRCPLAVDRCHAERPRWETVGTDAARHSVKCHRWQLLQETPGIGIVRDTWKDEGIGKGTAGEEQRESILSVDRVETVFSSGWRRSKRGRAIRAVDGVSLELGPRETLGVVGESGSGKTTLLRTILGLEQASGGTIVFLGSELEPRVARRSLRVLKALQFVAQHPDEALNPYRQVGSALKRPLRRLSGVPRRDVALRTRELLQDVGLSRAFISRWPRQLSGGEKQRVALARTLAAEPRVILLDEPTSSLDVSIQARLLNLLSRLQQQDRSMLFISHDLAVIGYLADRIVVMYAGRVMEQGTTRDVLDPPYHPYTELLLRSIPQGMRPRSSKPVVSAERLPDRYSLGCPFASRCPFAWEMCRRVAPDPQIRSLTHRVFCHLDPESLPREAILEGLGKDDADG